MKSGNQAARKAIWIFAAVFSLWLRTGVPVLVIGGAVDDDALFIRGAHALGTGHWLGHYDETTLAKGMFYPLFIAIACLLSIPLKLAEHAVYLLASALTARFVGQRGAHPWLATLLFVLLAFNPVLWSVQLSRVIREGLYISLSLFVIVLEVMVFFSPSGAQRRRWLAAACGLMLGVFWLTREEGMWIVPALAIVAAFGIGAALRPAEARLSCKAVCGRLGVPALSIVIVALCFAAPNLLVAAINDRAYGVFETVEFKSSNFVRAYSALADINPASWQQRVVIPADARQLAYQVSPAARELKPYIDGPIGDALRLGGCEQTHVPLGQCKEILAGWFMWVLRGAVAQSGHAKTARDADAFYGRLADELEAACDEGRFACLSRHPTLAPPFHWSYAGDVVQALGRLVRMAFTLESDIMENSFNSGTPGQRDIFADLTGAEESFSDKIYTIAGWAGAKTAPPIIEVQSQSQTIEAGPTRLDATDVKSTYPDLQSVRFNLSFECPEWECTIKISSPDGTDSFPVDGLSAGRALNLNNTQVIFDTVKTVDRFPVTAAHMRLKRRIALAMSKVYHVAMPWASALALAGFLIAGILRRGPGLAIYALAAGSLAAISCRLALLAYLEATSIPSVNTLYASPATPFVIVFAVTGLYSGYTALIGIRLKRTATV